MIEYNLLILLLSILTSVHAYTAVGYLGCYHKNNVNSFVQMANSGSNSGEECKQRCLEKDEGYRYAGTRKGNQCYCNTTFGTYETTNGCDKKCKGNSSEFCGGNNHVSIHDMWKCVTVPCKNNASCEDIDGTNYTCSCTGGWTGEHCDQEPLPGTTSTVTNATATSTSASPPSSSTLAPSLSSQHSSISASVDTSQTTTRESAISSSSIDNNSPIAVYVSVPVAIILLSFVSVVAFFIWRCRAKHRRRVPAKNPPLVSSTTKEGTINHYTNHNSATLKDGQVTDNIYTEIDLDNLQSTSDVSNNEYNMIEQRTIELPENSYGHLINGPFIDTTYSHMDKYPVEKKSGSMDNTYSHIGHGTTEAIFKQTAVEANTYNVLQTTCMSHPPEWNKETKQKEYDNERDSTYDHAIAKSHDDDADEYAHLNRIAADTDPQRDGHIAAFKDIINKADDLLDSQRNGGYEQAVGPTPLYAVLESEDQVFAINDIFAKEQGTPYVDDAEYEGSSNHYYSILEKMDS